MVNSGKWYAEYIWESNIRGMCGIGVADVNRDSWLGDTADGIGYYYSGLLYSNNATLDTYSSYAVDDVIGIALDLDSGTPTVKFYKNNSLEGTENLPAAFIDGSYVTFGVGHTDNASVMNFGQDSSFAGNLTAQGNGGTGEDFYYTPPAGFKALNTDNLPDPAIADPTKHFNTVLYTGNATIRNITDVGFQSDFTWIKMRDAAYPNNIFDSIRGDDLRLQSNNNFAEASAANTVTFGNANGFSLGTDSGDFGVNKNTSTFVAWNWDMGGSNATNTNGSITSTVRANTTYGQSIVSYTGNATAGATVGHGLSSAPDMIILKDRDAINSWRVYSSEIPNTQHLILNDTNALVTGTHWNNTTATSSVFSLGSNDAVNGARGFIAYCFHSVEGYSKIGTYASNNSTDGPFVYLGFTPAFIMLKCTNATDNWNLYDIKRNGYNGTGGTYQLRADTTAAGFTAAGTMVDLVSNGMKIRTNDPGTNGLSRNYIYLAFAESPFKTSRAR